MPAQPSRRKVTTIWTQVLLIALVPSVAVLAVGATVAIYLVNQGSKINSFADDVRGSLGPVAAFVAGIQEERRLTMTRAIGQSDSQTDLEAQRRAVDDVMPEMTRTTEALATNGSDDLRATLANLTQSRENLPTLRRQIDSNAIDAWKAYKAYNVILDLCGETIQGIAKSSADAEAGFEQMISYDLFKSAEAMSRSHAMAVRAVAQGLDPTQFHEMAHQLGMYHEQANSIVPRMTPQERDAYAALNKTPEWATLVANDNSLMNRGPGKEEVKFDVAVWEDAAQQVGTSLMNLYHTHSQHAAALAAERGRSTLLASIVGGGVILLIAVAAMVVALQLSRKLVRRLRTLREQTLDQANNGLPQLVATIREGKPIDVEKQVAWLDHGGDEIGQVANAFNAAQRSVIQTAVREAETKQGVRSVFLAIAQRSQTLVHRQLKVLGAAERSAENPDQLQLLFKLDHLSTRARRNAENLIIMAGERPGRQWRNPVSLRDIVRSAIAETEEFTRVITTGIPDVPIVGAAVADVVHLLAELVDNSTEFSPKEVSVEVRGKVVGRGVVLEIEDQGHGIEETRREALNAMLQNPPDFDVMATSTQSRIGLFVVARLAARCGMRVSLRESVYGGIDAIVLIPNQLIANSTVDTPAEVTAHHNGVPMQLPKRQVQPRSAAAQQVEQDSQPQSERERYDWRWPNT
ncbi:HAMP domain-containing protein [Kibdelosporangium aridum]|uniref:histidine kinase n=1 Tax=Kibdelosporangium aridum TaxID=2030 RepID=A0A428ZE15_KIBAR|nr:nitrate- and nitrite sensing domain-containing protein [Kibdelosporangium aridum]RSM86314.1 HAMP domain-containing protein [Kibdelosporangium aridum]